MTTQPPVSASGENPGAGAGAVVLDIGGDIGALVVSAPAELAGAELEICPAGARETTPDEGGDWWDGEWRSSGHTHDHGDDSEHHHDHHHHHHDDGPAWPHVAVIPRAAMADGGCAAVFPGLRAGDYEVWRKPDGPIAVRATVAGGEVTAADWPAETR